MRTRHITLSREQGMITELEMIDSGFASGERYILRHHKPPSNSTTVVDFVVPYSESLSWTGFLYRNDEVSVLLQRQGDN